MENNADDFSKKPNRQKEIGPVAGSIIVILVVLAGGVYFWGNKIVKNNQTAEVENQAKSDSFGVRSSKSDAASETENQDKNLDNLDQEIQKL